MNINFNYKKTIIRIFIIIICLILLNSFSNVKAWSDLNSQFSVDITNNDNESLSTYIFKGDYSYFNDYLNNNFNIDDLDVFYSNAKTETYTYLGYSSWEDFTNDYYYISIFHLGSASSTANLDLNIYYSLKSSNNNFNIGIMVSVLSGGVNSPVNPTELNVNKTYRFMFGAINSTGVNRYIKRVNSLSTSISTNDISRNASQFIKNCTTSSSNDGCAVSGYSNNVVHLNLSSGSNGSFLNFLDSNKPIDVYFSKPTNYSLQNNDFIFQNAYLNGVSSVVYPINTLVSENILGYTTIDTPNIKDLGNNSFALFFNTIDNIFFDWENSTTSSIRCSSDRAFVNDICFLYDSDITNFNVNNSNVSNSAVFYLGANNTINIDSSKYYVFTFRLYTNYDLDILTTMYHINGDSTDYSFIIKDKYYADFTIYRDISIVFQPENVSTGTISFIDIVFQPLSNFTNVLDKTYSFGIFNTVKYSQFDSLPSQTDVEREIYKNGLTDISRNDKTSFFSNFVVDDHGLSSIVLFPLNFARSFQNYSCSFLNLPVNHIGNVNLPCVSSFMNDNFSTIWNVYRLIFNGFIIYRLLINLYSTIKNSYRPDNDRIEVVDL